MLGGNFYNNISTVIIFFIIMFPANCLVTIECTIDSPNPLLWLISKCSGNPMPLSDTSNFIDSLEYLHVILISPFSLPIKAYFKLFVTSSLTTKAIVEALL